MKEHDKIKYVVLIGLFSAMSFAFTMLGHLIPVRIQGFLSYDPKDILVVIAGFVLGPVATILIAIISSLIEMVTISTTGLWGLLMNILSTVSFAFVASIIYKKKRTLSGAIIGLILGILTMTLSMMLWNYFVTPVYMGVPRETVAKMLPTVFLPFNLLKATANASITMLLYKPIVGALRKTKLIENSPSGKSDVKLVLIIISFAILLASVFLFLMLGGVI